MDPLQLDQRIRKPTEAGKMLYEYSLQKFTEKLAKSRTHLESALNTSSGIQIREAFKTYEKLSSEFVDFLTRTRTQESQLELTAHRYVFNAVESRTNMVLQNYFETENPSVGEETVMPTDLPPLTYLQDEFNTTSSLHSGPYRPPYIAVKPKLEVTERNIQPEPTQTEAKLNTRAKSLNCETRSQSSRRSKASKGSNISSIYLQKKVEVQEAMMRLSFAEQEAELEKEQVERSSKLKLLRLKKESSVAQVGLKVMDEYMNDLASDHSPLPAEEITSQTKVENYLRDQQLHPDVPEFIPNAHIQHTELHMGPKMNQSTLDDLPPPGSYGNTHIEDDPPILPEHRQTNIVMPAQLINPSVHELTKYIMRKDITMQRLSSFSDKAEAFLMWKTTFRSVLDDLNVTDLEEIDLLIKYLGPDSRRHAESLRIANAADPKRALEKIWKRLEERYGSPELIEFSLRQKLANFPKLSTGDKRLYELADLLAEIQSVKEQEKHKNLMASYDSSAGVNPIVTKLPTYLQHKWTSFAGNYKKAHDIMFPPFSTFVEFVSEHATRANDPCFDYSAKSSPKPQGNTDKERKATGVMRSSVINAFKTEVSGQTKQYPEGALCPIHSTSHSLNDCRAFQKKPMKERKEIMKFKGACYKCGLIKQHIAKDCNASVICQRCKSTKHCTALHEDMNNKEAPLEANVKPVNTKCTSLNCSEYAGKSCAKILMLKVYPKLKPESAQCIYAIIDDQSNRSLATTDFFENFSEDGPESEYVLSSCAGVFAASGRRATGYVAESADGLVTLDMPSLIECNEIPHDLEEIPTPEIAMHYDHLRDIAADIPPLYKDTRIMLLIGRDLIDAHRVLDQRIGPSGSPIAQRLELGWVIIGEICSGGIRKSETVNVNKTKISKNGRPTLFDVCKTHFKTTEEPSSEESLFVRTLEDNLPGPSIDDLVFLEMMEREMTKNSEGYWEAPLPLHKERKRLPNNRDEAMKRARSLVSNLRRNPKKCEHFVNFMKGILEKGHAEIAPAIEKSKERWYLPIFGVYHPKKPEKIRIVFDSSAKCEGISLNDVLLKGPDLSNSLLGILIRFRREAVACMADVQQMFHCFHVREEDRNFLRFLWGKDNNPDNEIIEYRMRVHTFGNSPSPAIATYGMRRAAHSVKEKYGEDIYNFVLNDFYVDDGLLSLPTTEAAVDTLKRTQAALLEGGNLRLHKISSNSQELMKCFPEEDLAESLKDLSLGSETPPLQRSLGIYWDVASDTFTCRVSSEVKPFTKRGVLSTIGSFYDPLGFFAPVIIRGKMFFRKIISLNVDWDDQLPTEFEKEWEQWKLSIRDLEALHIPRSYAGGLAKMVRRELHVFSDASNDAVAAVVYLRTTDTEGNISLSFVLGKAKLAPSGHTIPRLELCGAVLASQLVETVAANLKTKIDDVKLYTDSQIVLGYIHNTSRRFYVYVGNRVQQIRKSTQPKQWTYVSTEENPADQGTRSLLASKMNECAWLRGPKFLLESSSTLLTSDDRQFSLVNPELDKDIRPVVQVVKSVVSQDEMSPLSERFERFSEWKSLLRAISYLTHIAKSFVKPAKTCYGWHPCERHKDETCMQEVSNYIISQIQNDHYSKEIECISRGKQLPKNSPILELSPFVDDNGVLRVGGRMNKLKESSSSVPQHPIIIPSKCHVGMLLVRHYHSEVLHQGRHFTEGAIRAAGFWLVGGRRTISSVIHDCVRCRKLRARPQTQKMADLPVARITASAPFTHVGVDVFGPWQVVARKTRGGVANSKRWCVLFTCLAIRAVHIEVLEDMSSSSFINALRRFTAIRGEVKEFFSDRGTNFVGATDPLGINAINVEDGPVKAYFFRTGPVWRFNSPHSSHMGGIWERMIGIARRILDAMLLDNTHRALTHDVLVTLMHEISAIINSRPITQVSSDPDSPTILSPSMLLTLKNDIPHEPFADLSIKDMYRSQWAQVQVLANRFWSRWSNEYLHTLQKRPKWRHECENLEVGDIVILKDSCKSRRQWPTGRVTNVFPSEDNLVRKVELRVVGRDGLTTLIRPVSELVFVLR
ncbi:uncharacterized protein LOC117331014 [Pecten maximus]|uniref:uncharacterized protein LOC117331014 n=1 Tax=Pecten maximus TaxID=6579 RepID=UPI0014590D5A|nr:uncharacterized protein LOC117331014 [Pecten maximus]